MMDTVGQVSALSGGYGNSYAQTAGQQAYQGQLANLNNIVPDLYSAAQSRYASEGDQMTNELGLLQGMETSDRSAYETNLDNWQEELSYLYNKNADMSEKEYNEYLTDYNKWAADRDYWAEQAAAEQSQANWQSEYDLAAASSGGGGGRSTGGGGGNTAQEEYQTYISMGYTIDEAMSLSGYTPEVSEVTSSLSGGYNSGYSTQGYGAASAASTASTASKASATYTGYKGGKYYIKGLPVSKDRYQYYLRNAY
jgi:hypothetical protein